MEMPSLWSYSSVPKVPVIGIDQARRTSRAAISRRVADGAGVAGRTVGAVEKEVTFFDRPAVVAADNDAVNLLDVVLADVGMNQLAIERGRRKSDKDCAIRKRRSPAPGPALERIARRDAVLSVGADRIGTAGCQRRDGAGRTARILPSGVLRFWALPPGSMWLGSDIVGVAAIAQSEIHVAVRSEGDRAAVMIARGLAKGDDLPARGWDRRHWRSWWRFSIR